MTTLAPLRPERAARRLAVSVVIPALRWSPHLEVAIASARSQGGSDVDDVEVVVALGEGAPPPRLPPRVRVVANPQRGAPAGLNRAVRASAGDIVVRLDSRSVLPPGYVQQVSRLLARPQVGCAGGAQVVLDDGIVGSAYRAAFNSPLLGGARYRYSTRSGPIDTVYLGAWRREDLILVGGFDESLERNQDAELAERLRARDLVIWYDADLQVGYRADRSVPGLIRHHYEFGLWRGARQRLGQRAIGSRHIAFVAGASMLGVLGLAALRRFGLRTGVALGLGSYSLLGGVAGACARRLGRRVPEVPRLHPLGLVAAPALAVVLDGAWVMGVLRTLAKGQGAVAPSPAPCSPPDAEVIDLTSEVIDLSTEERPAQSTRAGDR